MMTNAYPVRYRAAWLRRVVWCLIFAGWATQVSAQWDTLPATPRLSITRLVIPSAFIATGLYTLSGQHSFNRFRIRNAVQNYSNGYRTHLDDYLTFGPTVLLAGLTAAGVQGRSTPVDRAGFWLTANALAGVVTYGLKRTTGELRPDGSNRQSFPSGHTSFAFAGAGVLDREFGQTNVLIPVAGYAMAGATGYLRMVNDKHWVSDVLVGAGIGLLSAEAAYRLYPWVNGWSVGDGIIRPLPGKHGYTGNTNKSAPFVKNCFFGTLLLWFCWSDGLAQASGGGIIGGQQPLVSQTLQAIYNNNPAQANTLLNQLDQRTAHHPAAGLLRAVRLNWLWFPARTDDKLRNDLVTLLEQTATGAKTQLAKRADDPELLFTYFTAEAMLTRMAYYDHQTLKSVGYAKNAYSYLQKGRAFREQYPDFYLSSGLYDYYREEYPDLHPVYKSLVWLMRSGDKQKGLQQLLIAARQSLFSQVEATLYLTHILSDYEHRAPEALPYLAQLAKQYPNNPFFAARYAEVLLNAGQTTLATPLIDSMLSSPQPFYQQIGLLLKARLLLSQGAAKEADALAQRVLQHPPRDEAYQAWLYTVRARVAAQTGQAKQAVVFYKKVQDLAEFPILSNEARAYLAK